MGDQFRTTADRKREELEQAQGIRPNQGGALQGNPLGILGLGYLGKQAYDALPAMSEIGSSLGLTSAPGMEAIGTALDGGTISASTDALSTGLPVPESAMSGIGGSGYLLPGLGIAAGGYGLYDALSKDKEGLLGYAQSGLSGAGLGAGAGALIGSGLGPIGAAVGAGLGLLGKLAVDLFDSGKSREQKSRDAFRDLIVKQGIASRPEGTDDTLINLFSGGTFDAGRDGQNKLTNQAGTQRRMFEVDFTQPGIGETVSALDPLGTILAYQSGMSDQRENATGYLVNAVTSQGGTPEQVQANVLEMYRRSGYTPDEVLGSLNELAKAGKITPDQLKVWTDKVYGLSGGAPQQQGGGISMPSIPVQKPSVDMNLLRNPGNPMQQAQQQYEKTQGDNRFTIFPKQDTYQPLGALG